MPIKALVESIHGRSDRLGNANEMLADLIISNAGEGLVRNPMHRYDMNSAALHNVDQLATLHSWATSELVTVAEALANVQSGSYLEDYNRIDATLLEAVINR